MRHPSCVCVSLCNHVVLNVPFISDSCILSTEASGWIWTVANTYNLLALENKVIQTLLIVAMVVRSFITCDLEQLNECII